MERREQGFLGCGAGQRNEGGIDFIFRRKWSKNIISCRLLSARVGVLIMQTNRKKIIKIIQMYAPTSASDDKEVEDFYRELDEAKQERSTYTFIMGDFNTKHGKGRPTGTSGDTALRRGMEEENGPWRWQRQRSTILETIGLGRSLLGVGHGFHPMLKLKM